MTTSSEKMRVLVVGASGSFGSAVARSLVARGGFDVAATARPGGNPVNIAGLHTVTADATDFDSLMAASAGADVIVYGLNVLYHRWHEEMDHAVEVLCQVAEARRALVVLPGNVYGLGPDFEEPLAEDCPKEAPTAKGVLRNRIEARLVQATERGARLLVVRAGDYFGPGATHTSWLSMLTSPLPMGLFFDPAGDDTRHQWAYLPDVAANTVSLLERRAQLPKVAFFHHGGPQVTSRELLRALREGMGRSRIFRVGFPWWMIRLAARLSPLLHEVLEMRYLWREPVLLDDGKLRRVLGPDAVQVTALPHALATTMAGREEIERGSKARSAVAA